MLAGFCVQIVNGGVKLEDKNTVEANGTEKNDLLNELPDAEFKSMSKKSFQNSLELCHVGRWDNAQIEEK